MKAPPRREGSAERSEAIPFPAHSEIKPPAATQILYVTFFIFFTNFAAPAARMVELVDTLDLKSNGRTGRAGSSPAPGTQRHKRSFLTSCLFSGPSQPLTS